MKAAMEVVSLPPELQEFLAVTTCMKRSHKNEAANFCGANGSSQLGLTQELVSQALLWLCTLRNNIAVMV